MASDSLRAAIINEVEESFNQAQDKNKLSLRLEALSSWVTGDEDDFLVSPAALEQCKRFGLDCRYSFLKNSTSCHSEQKHFQSKSCDDSMLEERLQIFLSSYEENRSTEDEQDALSAKDRVMGLKLHQKAFEPLLIHLKDTRPVLCRMLQQNSLLTGKMGPGKRRQYRKAGKGDKRVIERDVKESRINRDRPPVVPTSAWETSSSTSVSKECIDSSLEKMDWDHYRYVLAVIVAKAVTNGSLQSILIAVSLLFQVLKDNNDRKSTKFIPVGDILCAIFDKKSSSDKKNIMPVTVPNPFRRCMMQDGKSSELPKGRAMSDSVSRLEDVCSLGTADEQPSGSNQAARPPSASPVGLAINDDSKFLFGANSDAGSTVGSTVGSLMAEQGTETASVGGGGDILEHLDIVSEDATEDELLAQALALSLGASLPGMTAATQNVSFNVGERTVSPTPSDSTTRDSVKRCGSVINYEKLAEVYPLSTYGPFCSEDFWAHCLITETAPISTLEPKPAIDSCQSFTSSIDVPVENVIIALVTYVRAGVDAMLCEDSAPWMDHECKNTEKGCKSDLLIAKSLEIVPINTTHFSLLENLLDASLQALSIHCKNTPVDEAAPTVIRNNQERVELEIARSKWNFEKYFLVWMSSSVLSILRANFTMLSISGTPPSSVGLDLRRSSVFSALGSMYAPSTVGISGDISPTHPLLCRLLKLIIECLGGNHVPNGSISGRVDDSLGDSSTLVMPSRSSICHDDESYVTSSCPAWVACDAEYRHCLTVSAAETFSKGYSTFFLSSADRDNVLHSIIYNSSPPGNLDLGHFFLDRNYFTLSRYCSSIPSFKIQELLPLYYRSHLLQKICLEIASSRMKPFFYYGSRVNGEISMTSDNNLRYTSIFDDYAPASLPGVSVDRSRADFIGFWPPISEPRDLGHDFGDLLASDVPANADVEPLARLYSSLLSRLGQSNLMKEYSDRYSKTTDKRLYGDYISGPVSCMFWGELSLLETIQMCFLEHMYNPPEVAVASNALTFDSARCSKNIYISTNGCSISQQKSKEWSTVATSRGFQPKSGVHMWSVHVEKCTKGNIFIGVVTSDASVNNYVGYDRHGWGFIGTPSLWHDHSKIRSNYGVKIAVGSVVNVTLDTEKRTLSYVISGTDWGIAFDNLPEKVLYPAVSLYQSGDAISIILGGGQIAMPPSLSIGNRSGSNEITDMMHIMKYFSAFFGILDEILQVSFKSEESEWNPHISLNHPFVVTLFPQLAAALVNGKFEHPRMKSYVALHFLPYLTLLTKMLASAHDKYPDACVGAYGLETNCIVGDLSGEWKIESSAVGSIPSQTYYVSFASFGCTGTFEKGHSYGIGSVSDILPSRGRTYLQPIHFSGNGSSGVLSVQVVGTVIGTRIRFQETWVGNEICTIDGRLSLDGGFFSGSFASSNHSGAIVGTRLLNRGYCNNYSTINTVLKAAVLGVMACGALSCNLMIGFETSEALHDSTLHVCQFNAGITIPDNSSDGNAIVFDSGFARGGNESYPADSFEVSNDELGEGFGEHFDSSGDDDMEEDGDFEREEKGESSVSYLKDRDLISTEPAVSSPDSPEQIIIEESKFLAWISSSFLSNGLHIDGVLADTLQDEMLFYTQEVAEIETLPLRKKVRLSVSGSEGEYALRSKIVHDAWTAQVFTSLISRTRVPVELSNVAASSATDPDVITGLSHAIPRFCQSLIDAKSGATSSGPVHAYQLDQYIVHHTGMAALSRIGGDVLQNARRAVLAALIKHCGCSEYCERAAFDVATSKISMEDRPAVLLIQIWSAGQRVIEQAIRKKQQSGVSYGFLGQELCAKARFMFSIQPQSASVEISEILCLSNFDVNSQIVMASIQDMSSKILSDAVDILQASMMELNQIKSALIRASMLGLSRTAAFKSIYLLIGKLDDMHWITREKIPVISNTLLQSVALQYITLGIYGSPDISSLQQMIASKKSGASKLTAPPSLHAPSINSSNVGPKSVSKRILFDDNFFGYYGVGLNGCSAEIFQGLRSSVESVYDFIGQFLQRCTWGSDRNGQCTALACWNIHLLPEDHQFLNRCGIFKVLQSVLNEVRQTVRISTVQDYVYNENPTDSKLKLTSFLRANVINAKLVSSNRLSRLAMLTVHSLASQVAFSKELSNSSSHFGRPLQRQPSGPETLSQALFDMLFAELFCSFRQLIEITMKKSNVLLSTFDWNGVRDHQKLFSCLSNPEYSDTAPLRPSTETELSLHGEKYIHDILRLLFSVSGSVICRKYLTSPKWLTLFFSGLGYGGIGVQRRLLRLLRRLLGPMNVLNLHCYVPQIFSFGNNDLLEGDIAFDDEDSKMLSSEGRTDDSDLSSTRCAKKIVEMVLVGTAAILPIIEIKTELNGAYNPCDQGYDSPDIILHDAQPDGSASESNEFISMLNVLGTNVLLSAESIYLIRSLMDSATWIDHVVSVLEAPLIDWKDQSESDSVSGFAVLRKICSVVGVLGGFPDRVYEGGIVALKPMSLVSNGGMESIALRLASISHSCGLVVDKSKNGGVDVILIEPKREKQSASVVGPDGEIDLVSPEGFKFNNAVPVKTIRVGAGDATPISEIPPIYKNLGHDFVSNFALFVQKKCLTEISNYISADFESDASKGYSDIKNKLGDDHTMLHTFLNTATLRALSRCTDDINFANLIIENSPALFFDALTISMTESLHGGLAVIEKIEEYWCELWDNLTRNYLKKFAPVDLSPSKVNNLSHHSSLPADASVSRLSRSENVSESNRDVEDSLSFSSTGISLLSAMRLGQRVQQPQGPERSTGVLSSLFGLSGRARPSTPATSAFGSVPGGISENSKKAMMEMGFRPEWCDAALRRSRNNVEIAINLCFEHGDDMDRLVEEDAAMLQQQQAAANRVSSLASRGPRGPPRPSAYIPRIGRRLSSEGSSGDVSGERQNGDEITVDPDAVRHMTNLGFPTSWCMRALSASSNDPDEALTWILTHADDLLVEFPGTVTASGGSSGIGERLQPRRLRREGGRGMFGASQPNDGNTQYMTAVENPVRVDLMQPVAICTEAYDESESELLGISPLTVLAGQGSCADDYTCSANGDGSFPSFGCRGYAVTSGKWYFEVFILTTGCIQIGWVDCGYIGLSENGQGVGDCLHSWCFDGWRVMLWHEISAEWGARWTPGNILGCAIDMDAKKMIFSLNGETESIGMGEAFGGFRCQGGMYPACSLSQGQQIRYRFGSKGFKYQPPAGYKPFAEHIISVNNLRKSMQPTKSVVVSLSNLQVSGQCEDTIEEEQGESECNWQRRYFPVDESLNNAYGGASRPIQCPEPALCRNSSASHEETLKQFQALSMDLSILYARLTVLRILESSKFSAKFDDFVMLLTTTELRDRGYSAIEAVLKLTRLCSITSNRTRLYLQTVALMTRSSPKPQNLGSIYSIGGFPVIGTLYESLFKIISKARLHKDKSAVCAVLTQLKNELMRSTQRDQCTKWKSTSGFIPSVIKSGQLLDSLCSTLPSLNLAVGLTILLINQLSNELYLVDWSKLNSNSFCDDTNDLLKWGEDLCRHWCLGLQAPSIAVKLCCLRMLNAIFQEIVIVCGKFAPDLQSNVVHRLRNIIPFNRLEQLALNRIKHERGVYPVCSEYLQALLELLNSVSISTANSMPAKSEAPKKFSVCAIDEVPTSEDEFICQSSVENENSSVDFNWDAMEGILLSNESWDIWTGTVRQLPTEEPASYLNQAFIDSARDRNQKQPPELLIGCKVARKKKIDSTVEIEQASKCDSQQIEEIGNRNHTSIPRLGSSSSQPSRRESSSMSSGLQNVLERAERAERESNIADTTGSPSGGVRSTFSSIRQRIAESETRPRSSQLAAENESNRGAPISLREGFLNNNVGDDDSPIAQKGTTLSDFEWEIGTVVSIVNHPACESLPGSARVVRWDRNNAKLDSIILPNLSDNSEASKIPYDNTPSEEEIFETVSWGHRGAYDVTHVTLNADGTINQRYPTPRTNYTRAIENGFGTDQTFGVILRIRKSISLPSDKDEGISERFDGIMEFCDFGASVYITGLKWEDGAWTITEERLLTGLSHSSWSVRFGHSHWRAGTTYDVAISKHLNPSGDKNEQILTGQFSIPINLSPGIEKPNFNIIGDISLQKNNLFIFDENLHSSAINLSLDKLSAFSDGKESRSTVFGNIGFIQGVHYWEFKIEQGDLGNIFVGVAEKPGFPGQSSNLRLNRWLGSGFVNIRTSFKHTPSGTADRIYGDHFHTGDTVGVLLDMDRGRLSFFLDGLKYGEHTLTDLGEAFDGLKKTNSYQKPLFPVVGMRRNLDRVTITPRWLSNYGPDAKGILETVRKASGLLSSWNFERPAAKPLTRDMWIYREAWRDHFRWIHKPLDRVRTRCKAPLLYVGVDDNPTACAEASIRLGLPTVLFRGDKITFVRSGGRLLESGEEAVILGAYRGVLWYRLDTQHGSNTGQNHYGSDESVPFVLEGSSLAWQLCAHDIGGIVVGRRANYIDPRISALKLPRIPAFKGARLKVEFSNGAIMRDGIEIDTSEVIGTVDLGAVVTAFERRKNSSNILRYRVAYKGKIGWISDRIRGGSEEHMVSEVTNEPNDVVEKARLEAVEVLSACRIASGCLEDLSESPWIDVATFDEAVHFWQSSVSEAVGTEPAAIFLRKSFQPDELKLDQFVDMAATINGELQWPVEADMQLAELISRIASKEGVSPLNVTYQKLKEVLRGLDPTNSLTSALYNIDVDRIIARASVLRVANIIFGYSLPYIDIACPEDKIHFDLLGRSEEVQVTYTFIPPCPYGDAAKSVDTGDKCLISSWQPPCDARKLQSLRRLLFSQTKTSFFESVLEMTMTPTPLPQDEYEEPREIKTIKVNRVMATSAKLSMIKNNSERLKVSVFGQLYREMRTWSSSTFRRSYIGKGHGGQKRAFKVKFVGEGVNDYGGPYRAVFEQVIDEVQCDTTSVAGHKPWEKTLMTLLVPCPNRASATGVNQDKFMFIPSIPSPPQQELVQFLGRITGMAVRHNLTLGLDFSSLIWRPLVRLPLARGHLKTVDSHAASSLERIQRLGLFLENRLQSESQSFVCDDSIGWGYDEFASMILPEKLDSSFVPPDWGELNFTVYLSDGYTRVPLVPGGENKFINLGNWREYIRLVEEVRLHEGTTLLRLFKDGLSTVLPVQLLPLFTASELELIVSGTRKVDIELLRKCTEYENLDPDSTLVRDFWSVLQEMDDNERTFFLRFVWARSRMPATAQDFPMNFKLQAASTGNEFLPHAQTCFFSLALPAYQNKEILREKLLYAINNSPNMDADVRLHNAEGWADS